MFVTPSADTLSPSKHTSAQPTVADAWLRLLKHHGVNFLFGNAGTDFPSIIEAYARAAATGAAVPTPILAPHENAAIGMAHGYAMVTGRAQAAMVHVNVGTANALAGIMNASREHIPMLVAAGRTPILEAGPPGARSMPIHWAQEMFDQAGIVREMVRWDYELRDPRQLDTVVERAMAITRSAPRGPVYLALPREVLAEPAAPDRPAAPLAPAAPAVPGADAIARAADLLANARHPMVIATRLGINPEAVAALGALADAFALPVVDYRPRYLNLPADHLMHAGYEVAPWIGEADVILVLDSDVPWLPDGPAPHPDCRIIQLGHDPLFSRYPVRGFRADVTLAASPVLTLHALHTALESRLADRDEAVQARRAAIVGRIGEVRATAERAITPADSTTPMGKAWASRCIAEAAGPEAIIVNEYPFVPAAGRLRRPGSYFGSSSVSGLGWGLPAALGAQLAEPDRLVVATLGDGAYMFANPTACHQIAQAHTLPVLTVVFNNGEWGAVRRATADMYPDGQAVQAENLPFVSLSPAPAYEMLVQASGGHGERVDDANALPDALARAVTVVRNERRQALLNVICG
ncbi:thiamine pyrophosphate-requiring protein [Marinivivus vitaminiproducens]|uniref:thiamine pyrophosphate-requiring protein n=1 Tax=Marinivivus vitaminiproducens TaxID=3035935 RepID=UPI00279D07E9|nr:thiamine pyrophosphate-requiring protein [Geminicoccaceae bacterium SCSIO 64248]